MNYALFANRSRSSLVTSRILSHATLYLGALIFQADLLSNRLGQLHERCVFDFECVFQAQECR
jgi:hypothetical protein